MPSPPRIRTAGSADARAIARVFAPYATGTVVTFETTPPSEETWSRLIEGLTATGHPFLVAERDGEVLGFAYASPWRTKPAYRQTVEDSVYVAEGNQGVGVGRALLNELLERCRLAGFRTVVAVIALTGHPASVALHASLGFSDVGTIHNAGSKLGVWVDTHLMQLDLSTPGGEGPRR